jgi:cobalt-zinc-cadmium efflux system protein
MEREILCMDGVQSVHAYHAWSLDGDKNVVTMHVVCNSKVKDDMIQTLRREVRNILSKYNINHTTVEIEREEDYCEDRS